MASHDSAEHDVFGKLFCFRLNHHDRILRTGDAEVEFAFRQFLNGWIDDVFAVFIANAAAADRAHERNAGNGQRCRRSNHGNHVRVILAVIRHSRQDNLNFVLETFNEKRTDRTVNETGCQRFFFGRTTFALEETARNAASSVVFFHIVYGQRKKILTWFGFFLSHNGGKHSGFAISGKNGTVCLTRNASCLQDEWAARPFCRHYMFIEHILSFTYKNPPGAGLLLAG